MPPQVHDYFKLERLYLAHLDQICELEPLIYGVNCWSRKSFVNEINNPSSSYFTLLERPTKVIGYGGYWDLGEEGHITTLAISPEYQGLKLGEYLFLQLLKDAIKQNITQLTLEVRSGNHKAQSLYKKYRFDISGIRPNYYRDNQEDAVIMWAVDLQTPDYRKLLIDREDLVGRDILSSCLAYR
ncbi:MAG: ribosomal protein S18-alanine N-acetyltransferase [Candidatus Caenarcaniphilales bacterium]|nr:ribosomal protein S18-alanine N-acetyltransferase [Candidatus Caenarcaniphilales bacterium]